MVPPTRENILDIAFTPDGDFLDYTISPPQGGHGVVNQIPVLGGAPRHLLDGADTAVSFSPDGRQMAYVRYDAATSEGVVMTAKADGSGARKLISNPTSLAYGDYGVQWSPHGQHIAFVTSQTGPEGLHSSLKEVDISTGVARPILGKHWQHIYDFAWLPDGSGLLVSAMEKIASPLQLWIIPHPGGAVRRASNDLADYISVAVSSDARLIAAVQQNRLSDLWTGASSAPDTVRQITTGRDDGLRGLTFSPDGRVVYSGNHSQNWDLFMADPDGENSRQLTFDGRFHESPAVCDHGRNVVYTTEYDGVPHLGTLNLRTGTSSKLSTGGGELQPSCTAAGDWIYYWGQVAGGTFYVFKMPVSGGTKVRLSDRAALSPPTLSQDGRHIVFIAQRPDGRIVAANISAETGDLELEKDIPPTYDLNGGACWMPDNRHVAIVDVRTGVANLWAIPVFAGGADRQLTHFSSDRIWRGCSYSSDGKRIAIARGPNTSDVVLFSNTN